MKSTLFAVLFAAGRILTQPLFGQAPEIPFDSTPGFLKMPPHIYMGEAAGVATNSRGNVFVYTRTGGAEATIGGSRLFTHGGSRLFEFDSAGKYIREIGQGVYGFLFAQAVRIDPQDNIWVVDQGSNMIIRFDPSGRVAMTLGRKAESINVGASGAGRGGRGRGAVPGDNFNRPTGVAWDADGNIYVADGIGNSRIAKFDSHGKYLKSWPTPNPNSIAIDSQGNVYAGDPANDRIQVFDSNGTAKTPIAVAGKPSAVCISPGAHQYLYGATEKGEIYRMELDGHALGKLGKEGKLIKEFDMINQIDCRNPNMLMVGELANWRVQRLTLHP